MAGPFSECRGCSDNRISFPHHSEITHGRNIYLLKGDSDSESSCLGGDSEKGTYFCQNSLSQPGWHRIHVDLCITLTLLPIYISESM